MTLKVLLAISLLSIATLSLPQSILAENNAKSRTNTMHERMEKIRTEIKNASGDASMKRKEEFKAQIQGMTDERKKKIVERLETRLSSMSAKRQDHLLEAHARLTEVYEKLVTKEQKLKSEGADTASATAALSEAKVALATAKEQITTQEPYTIDLSDEANLKVAVKELMKKMEADAQKDRAILHEAKEALRKATRALMRIEKLKKGETTNGPKPTTSK